MSPKYPCAGLAALPVALLFLGSSVPSLLAADPKAAGGSTAIASGTGGTTVGGQEVHANWKLTWEDDFSKDKELDKTKWNIEVKGDGGGNGEQQYYTDSPKNISIQNGELVITAIKENYKGKPYTSGKLNTKGKGDFLYGRIEACIKPPKAQKGDWPAFWMMPTDSKFGGWPKSGEIDIMEMVNKEDKLFGTLHFGKPGHAQAGVQTPSKDGDFSKDYHVFAVEREATEMRFFLDNKYFGTVLSSKWVGIGPGTAPFDQKFYCILNYAVGGQWPQNPDASSTFPQSMHVKYVRVYQPTAVTASK
jgi:beta-glucanase (GH16 family)